MFTRVMHIQSRPGKLDEVIALYRNDVMPALKQQRGYSSTILLTDPSTDKGMSITIWNSEADQQVSEGSGFLLAQIGKVAPLLAAQPVQESYFADILA